MARIAAAGFSGRIETTSGPWKRPAGLRRNVRAEHRHFHVLGDVPDLDAVLDQRLLERIGAADHERHEIVAPEIR